jgi:hypothetical protein
LRVAHEQGLLLDDGVADNAAARFEKLVLVAAANSSGYNTANV